MSTVQSETWNGRGNLEQLVNELNRQKDSRIDFVADTRSLWVEPSDSSETKLCLQAKPGASTSEFLGDDGVSIGSNALGQFASRQNPVVPIKFTRELAAKYPQTAANLFNDLLPNTVSEDGPRRFVRILDNRVRAFLSSKYRVLDNYDLAFTALDVVRSVGGQVIESQLSETKMRLKFTTQNIFDALKGVSDGRKGLGRAQLGNRELGNRLGWWTNPGYVDDMPGGPDTVHPLISIENSETGNGGLRVKVGLLAGICFNGCIIEEVASQVHLGGAMGLGIYTDETQAADSKATMLKIRDNIIAAFTTNTFTNLVNKVRESQDVPVADAAKALDNVIKSTAVTEESRDDILSYFLKDYQPTAYGMGQAISRYAQDVSDPEVSNDFEEAAGSVMVKPALVTA